MVKKKSWFICIHVFWWLTQVALFCHMYSVFPAIQAHVLQTTLKFFPHLPRGLYYSIIPLEDSRSVLLMVALSAISVSIYRYRYICMQFKNICIGINRFDDKFILVGSTCLFFISSNISFTMIILNTGRDASPT